MPSRLGENILLCIEQVRNDCATMVKAEYIAAAETTYQAIYGFWVNKKMEAYCNLPQQLTKAMTIKN